MQKCTLFLVVSVFCVLLASVVGVSASDLYYSTILSEPSLQSDYHLDEAAGASAVADAKGSNNLLTSKGFQAGQASLLASHNGKAALFDGVSGELTATSGAVFNFDGTQAFSFEFLAQPNVSRSGTDGECAVISNVNPVSPFNGAEIQLVYNNYNDSKTVVRLLIVHDFGAGNYLDVHGTTDLSNGTTHHVVVTYDGSTSASGANIYVDGVPDTVISTNALSGASSASRNSTIGARATNRFLPAILDEIAIYTSALSGSDVFTHYLAFLNTVRATSPMPTDPVAPVPVILDTDLASDVDDVGDLTVLNSLANQGEAKILAIITDSANAYSAPAAKAFLTYFGKGTVPIGAYQGSIPSGAGADSVYTQTINNEFGTPGDVRSNYPDATAVYRQTLAAAVDGSVVIVATGFFEPLSSLLQSSADSASTLTGSQLIAQKVKRLVVVAGIYPTSDGTAEFNLQQDPIAASAVFTNWPTQIISVGIEQGNTVFTGPPSAADPTSNPVKRAYNLFGVSTRQAWGQLGVLYGVRGLSSNFLALGLAGINTVDPVTGDNVWMQSPNRGDSFVGKVVSNSALQAILNPLFGDDPSDHPPFFSGEAPLANSAYFLRFANGTSFSYYSYLSEPRYIYHFDLGYEYWTDANDGKSGIYLYDFTSGDTFYTSPSYPFPYLYDLTSNALLYYYPNPENPDRYNTNGVRYFYDFSNGQIITK